MCRLWVTEISNFFRPNYFVIDESEFSLDKLRVSLMDLGYDCPLSFDPAEDRLCQINKGNHVLLLHTPEIDGIVYVAGLIAPYLKNQLWNKKRWKAIKAIGIALTTYIGILLGVVLAGLGVRGPERPYLLDWLAQNWLPLLLIGTLFFLPLVLMISQHLRLNLYERSTKAAKETYSDLKTVLEPLCDSLEMKTIPENSEPYYPWRGSSALVPAPIRKALDELVSKVDGYSEDQGSILDLHLKRIEPDEYRSY